MNSRLKVLLLITGVGVEVGAGAQTAPVDCRPIRANRHKTMTIERERDLSAWWVSHPGTIRVEQFFDGDTVVLYKGGERVNTFRVKGDEVKSAAMWYEVEGKQLVDSLDQNRNGRTNYYFGNFHSSHVVMTVNLTQNSKRYYNTKGYDSVMVVRYGNGVMRERVEYNANGAGVEKWQYTPEGILAKKLVKAGAYTYYGDGVLQSREFDTLVDKQYIRCLKDYYNSGVLTSVTWTQNGIPCYVWLYYSTDGVLTKNIKKKPLNQLEGNVGVVEAPPPPQVYRFAEQAEWFQGDFKQYMNEKLKAVLCESPHSLEGTYLVIMTIGEDGVVTFKGVSGVNAEDISGSFKKLFDAMPRWVSAKRNGTRSSLAKELTVVVK